MNVETEYRLSSTTQPVLNDLKDILPYIISLVNAEDLQKTIQVCRLFRDVTEADFRYLSLYLQRRGTTRYHIERFQQLLQDYPKPNYRLMLKRIRQLNRLDLHLLSNVIRTRLDKMQFQTWQLAVITGNVNYILDPRHTELSSIIKAYHDEKTASYFPRVACLLGMLNMVTEFGALPIDIRTDPYVLESYVFGLGRKGHLSHVINLEKKSFCYLDVEGNQVMETDNVPLENNLNRRLILGNLQCAKPLSIKDIPYAEMMLLSFRASNICGPALALACAFSSNLQNFQAFICRHPSRQNRILNSANFSASVLLSDNLSLFDYLLRAELMTINQIYFFRPHFDFTFHQPDRQSLLNSLNYALLDCEDRTLLLLNDAKVAKSQKEIEMIRSGVLRLTILQYAVCMGSLKIVKHLLSLNANTDCSASLTGTPLCLALITGHLSVANYLCQRGIVPNEEKALCSITSRSILHYLLRYDIREIEHQPDLYSYLQTQLSAQIQITKDGITTPVKLADVSSDRKYHLCRSQLTPLDVALSYRQVYTVMWLYKNKYYQRDPLDIVKMLNNLEIGAKTFDDEVRKLKFRAQLSQPDCSLKDFAAYLPPADDADAIDTIDKELFADIVNYILRHREETSYFLSESIKVLCERYGKSLDLRGMFEMNLNYIFANERDVNSDYPYGKLYQLIPMLYEDLIRHLLLPGKPLYHSRLPNIIINCQTDLYRLFYAYEQMQISRSINGEHSQSSEDEDGHEYSADDLHDSILHFFLDYYGKYPGTISTSILKDLFDSANKAELTFISQKDPLKRNLLCKLLDYYSESNHPQLFELITLLSEKNMPLDHSDIHGDCAGDRILKFDRYSKPFMLFRDKLAVSIKYHLRLFDLPIEDDACESEQKRRRCGP